MSFRIKTIIGIAIIEIVFLLILVMNSLMLLRDSNTSEVERRANHTLHLFAAMIKDSVISSDIASLEEFVHELVQQPDIHYVQIFGMRQLLAESGEIANTKLDESLVDVSDGVFDLAADISESGLTFGSVKIGFRTGDLDVLIENARNRLMLISAVEVLFVGIFSYWLGLYLTRQLSELKQANQRIAEGNYGYQVKVQGNDELAATAHAFNRMSKKLDEKEGDLLVSLHRLQAEKERADNSYHKSQVLLDSVLDGILTIDHKGMIQEINSAAAKLLGYEDNALLGQYLGLVIEDNMIEDTFHSIKSAFDRGVNEILGKRILTRALKKDGIKFPIELTLNESVISGQKTFIVLIRDLTEKEIYRKEMATQMAIHRAITEASLDALVSIDTAGIIREFSPAAVRLFGFSREEAIGRSLTETIVPKSAAKAHNDGMARYLATGEGPVIRNRIQIEACHKDGHLIPIEMVVTPIEVESNPMFTAFIHDISERKAYEESLKEAKRLAEAGSEAKTRFLATMSHEIRSPLNAILGSLDLLEETELSQKQGLYTQTAFDAGRALLGLINDILDFSKIEAGQLELDVAEFAPERLVSEVLHICQAKATPKNVDVVSYLARDLPDYIVGDLTRLRQVLINLMDNAIKFSDKGTVGLELSLGACVGEDIELKAVVKDQGIGIPKEKLAVLFDEFTQVDASHSTRFGGTGLGLAICSRLVNMMGGEMHVSSEVGKGSEFHFVVRLKSSKLRHRGVSIPEPGKQVMILHDNAYFADVLTRQFQDYGVMTAAVSVNQIEAKLSGQETRQYDLILIDESVLSTINPSQIEALMSQGLSTTGQLVQMVSDMNENRSTIKGLVEGSNILVKPLSRTVLIEMLTLPQGHRDISGENVISPPSNQRHPGRIVLLAEDSQANQVVARAMLEGAGFDVDIANNGMEAVAAVSEKKYGVVLMDMRMPEMDGLQATRAIRERYSKTDLPIIALTANASREDIDNCLNAGMNAYMSKPIRKDKLIDTVTEWVINEPLDEVTCQGDDAAVEHAGNGLLMVDKAKLDDLAEDTSPDLLPEIIRGFLTELGERVERVTTLNLETEVDLIEDEAHTIKSSSVHFGCMQLHHLAKQLEVACNNADIERCQALRSDLHKTANASAEALTQYLMTISN